MLFGNNALELCGEGLQYRATAGREPGTPTFRTTCNHLHDAVTLFLGYRGPVAGIAGPFEVGVLRRNGHVLDPVSVRRFQVADSGFQQHGAE